MATMLAAVLVGAAAGGSGDAMMGGIALGQGIAMQQLINFTRSEESEADRVGIGYLAECRLRHRARMPAFFEEMGRRMRASATAVRWTCCARTRSRASASPRRAPAPRSTSAARSPNRNLYRWMRERVRVLSADPSPTMTAYYARLRDRRALSDAERYGEALAQLRQNQPAGAVGDAALAAGRLSGDDDAVRRARRGAAWPPASRTKR